MTQKILRFHQVLEQTGEKRTTIYRKIAEGRFPKPIKLGPRASGWLSDEIDAYIAQLVAERDQGKTAA